MQQLLALCNTAFGFLFLIKLLGKKKKKKEEEEREEKESTQFNFEGTLEYQGVKKT